MMHQIVLLTAMTATTGLFGGGRQGVLTRYRAAYQPASVVARAPMMVYPTVNPGYQVQPQAPAQVAPPAGYYQSHYSAPAAPPAGYYQSNYYAPAAPQARYYQSNY